VRVVLSRVSAFPKKKGSDEIYRCLFE